MASWARPGVKVVCVDGAPHKGGTYKVLPEEGAVYTIAAVRHWVWRNGQGLGVDLLEVDRVVNGVRIPFGVERFRPLVSQSDDVALFTHHLDTTKLPERV